MDHLKNPDTAVEAIESIPVMPLILEVIARLTGMGFVVVAHVTDRKWVACAIKDDISCGLRPGEELDLETTICNEIRKTGAGVVIDNVADDPVYKSHHTPRLYRFKSYISAPIRLPRGEFFGTLSAVDPLPANLNNPAVVGIFKLLADLIAIHLQSSGELKTFEATILEERNINRLREQFIAMLGHDLRNPLTAIGNCAQLLSRFSTDAETQALAGIINKSAARMSALIEDTQDFARLKLGTGMMVTMTMSVTMEEVLMQVIDEQLKIKPGARILRHFDLREPVCFDSFRIAQLFSNLLTNALKYGDNSFPIKVDARSTRDIFTLSVTNSGEKISPVTLGRIFEPFFRGEIRPGEQGLGLGLFIAAEIARAHQGKLEVKSDHTETVFTLTMPAIC